MSELRSRMIRDMRVRGFSPRTHEAYIRQVVSLALARHYRRAPDQLSADEVQEYLAHLVQAEAVVEHVQSGGARQDPPGPAAPNGVAGRFSVRRRLGSSAKRG